jgi:hypothetical protein
VRRRRAGGVAVASIHSHVVHSSETMFRIEFYFMKLLKMMNIRLRRTSAQQVFRRTRV